MRLAILCLTAVLAFASELKAQLPLTGVGGGNTNLSVVNADIFFDTSANGSNGTQITPTIMNADQNGSGCTNSVSPSPLTMEPVSSSGFQQTFTAGGFNIKVGSTIYDGHAMQAGIGWSVVNIGNGTTTQKAICALTADADQAGLAFYINTQNNGMSNNLSNYGWFLTTNNGFQYSIQIADHASGISGCTNMQVGINFEVADFSATHGTCFPITPGNIYWVELFVDTTMAGHTGSVSIYNQNCGLVGTSSHALVSMTIDKIHQIIVGDNPDGATAGNGSTFISNVVIFKGANAKATGMGC